MDKNKNSNDMLNEQPSETDSASLWVKFKGNKLVMAVVIVAAILVVGGVAFALTSKSDPKAKNDGQKTSSSNSNGDNTAATNDNLFLAQNGQGCKERDVTFSSAPMKMNELAYIRPLGAVADGHVTPTDHVYVGAGNPSAAENSYQVLMPADGTIVAVAAMPSEYIGDRKDQKTASEDHRLVISHSCRYFSIYIHVHKLSDKVKAVVGELQPNESKNVSIDLKAGEAVGYIGNSTFDWTPIDASKKLSGFITPSLYDGEPWKVYTVSPFDLYKEPLKSQLEAKSLRSVAPLGGKIDYDQPGKLVGNWFREGSGGYTGTSQNGGRYWDSHLSVAPDYIDPTSTILSTGNWNGSAKQMVVKGSVDPSKVTKDSGAVKYELLRLSYVSATNGQLNLNTATKGAHPDQGMSLEGTILLQVLPGEKLKVENFVGKSAAQVSDFTAAAQTYYR